MYYGQCFNNYGVTVVGLMVQTLNVVGTSATLPTNPSIPFQGFIQDGGRCRYVQRMHAWVGAPDRF